MGATTKREGGGRARTDTCYKLLYTFLIKTLLRIVLRVGVLALGSLTFRYNVIKRLGVFVNYTVFSPPAVLPT